jgi:hypothetical protein
MFFVICETAFSFYFVSSMRGHDRKNFARDGRDVSFSFRTSSEFFFFPTLLPCQPNKPEAKPPCV